MIPTDRGRRPLRGNDDMDDDDGTYYSDGGSSCSYSIFSYDDFSSRDRQDRGPVFRLKSGEQDKAVYEAWNVYYYPGKREALDGRKVLGITSQNFEEIPSRTELRRQPSAQSELADMHLRAIEDFKTQHKRCWATRALRGRGKTYEQDLDERCRGVPADVRKTVTDLLFDKGRATSTRYRTRAWTVVAMREQLQDRFASTDFADVKRHKVRFWKNPKPQEHLLYTVVIRGAETKVVPAGEDGLATFSPISNPWMHCDDDERRRRAREERERRDAARQKRRTLSPSFRAPSPSYRARSPSYRARSPSCGTRTRSVSPPSYRSWRGRYDSPPPSARYSRSDTPPPYRSSSPRASPLPSRSPSVRIRVVPRYTPTNFDDTPFPPTPPESYTPPPGVSAYNRPCTFAPPPAFPSPYTAPTISPFQPRLPYPAPQMPVHHPMANNPLPTTDTNPPTPATCLGCRTTRAPPCVHHPRSMLCRKPILFHAGLPYHPPCIPCGTSPPTGPTYPHTIISTGMGRYPRPVNSHPNLNNNHLTTTNFTTTRLPAYDIPLSRYIPPHRIPHQPQPPLPASHPTNSSSINNWFPDSPGPMPPAPNPFSPLSTPLLTSVGSGSSAGGSSPALSHASSSSPSSSSSLSGARTPVQEIEAGVEVVRVDGDGEGEGVGEVGGLE
ncbi:uncharacterized protein B0H64DRAFT_123462 [Chaetomium fimeti]|uniref:Uncharacterized protein n=1 Tax=Chaetomium fimeti TaxID=1854472 RepID=A0AAE0LUJ8_9PEZI|nr:hypothetical protein B0H64DRAFT_123462 [Chaetomium fimeti]